MKHFLLIKKYNRLILQSFAILFNGKELFICVFYIDAVATAISKSKGRLACLSKRRANVNFSHCSSYMNHVDRLVKKPIIHSNCHFNLNTSRRILKRTHKTTVIEDYFFHVISREISKKLYSNIILFQAF